MNSLKLSVIVPVCNTESYITSLIESVLSQSFKNFELFLIDDGSKDTSGIICDEYSKKDSRVHVFHQENKGVSAARNLGIVNATGEWLYFPDSDDIVLYDAFAYMMSLISRQTSYVMCGYEVFDEGGCCSYAIPKRKQKNISVDEALLEMFSPSDYRYQGYLWNKLFKTSIINDNDIRFAEDIKFNEDRLFNVEYLCSIDDGDIVYSTFPVYKYFERSNSAMASLNQRFNPFFLTDLDAFVKMGVALYKFDKCDEVFNAHADSMYFSICRYYSMCHQFGEFGFDKFCRVETRFLRGVGFRKYIQIRTRKIYKKLKNICKNF